MIVYKIPCYSCNEVYHGYTTTDLKTIMYKHKDTLKPKSIHSSGLSTHIKHLNHEIDFDKGTILHRKYHKFKLHNIGINKLIIAMKEGNFKIIVYLFLCVILTFYDIELILK